MDILGIHVGVVDALCYGLAAAFVLYQVHGAQARAKGLRKAGAEVGLAPSGTDVEELPAGLLALPIFSYGNQRSSDNMMWGEGGGFAVFDFEYSHVRRRVDESRGRRIERNDTVQTACAVRVDGGTLPEFTLAPAGLGDAFLGLFGTRDIDLAQEPGFSAAYVLRGPDEDAVRRLFAAGPARALAERPGWTVQGKGEWVLYCRAGRTVAPEKLEEFLWEAKALHGAFFGV
ncbi:MAG: hypothetical protein HY928_05805 [Elusimicrobia bacterium]|nr:hypothetical protein [Elusimicrobiota bacterium]